MSPRKQRCVIGKLAESVGLKVTANDSSPSTSTSSHGSALMTPKRVCMNSTTVTFRGKLQGTKIESSFGRQQRMERTEQVRFMLERPTINSKRRIDPSLKVGLTRFYELRPTHVKLLDQIPHQVCVCSHHENVRFCLWH